jgi:Domain of unknown function (DUF4157)
MRAQHHDAKIAARQQDHAPQQVYRHTALPAAASGPGNQARLRANVRPAWSARAVPGLTAATANLPRIGKASDAAERHADRRAAGGRAGSHHAHPSPGNDPMGGKTAPPSVTAITQQSGRALDRATRTRMESRLGADLGAVRVHDDPPAARAAQDIGASAFAVGRHVALDRDTVRAGTPAGEQVLAHELAHASEHRAGAGPETGVVRRQLAPPSLATRYAAALAEARETGDYGQAVLLLNGFSRADILNRIAPLSDEELGRLYYASQNQPGVGPDSQVAELTNPSRPRASSREPVVARATRPAPAVVPAERAPAPRDPIAAMSGTERVLEAYRRANIGQALREHIESMVTPQALVLAILAFAAVFAVSMLTPVGWAAGLTLALTAVFIGMALIRAIRHMVAFADARNATTSAQLDEAGNHFAAAVAEISIDLLILLMTRGMRAGPGAAGPSAAPVAEAVRIAMRGDGTMALVPAFAIPVAAIEAAAVTAAPTPALVMAMSGGPREPHSSSASSGRGSSTPRSSTPRSTEERFIDRLREMFPRLRNLDIRPRLRPSASRYTATEAAETAEVGAEPGRRSATTGAPESAFEERMRTSQGRFSFGIYEDGRLAAELDGVSLEGWIEEVKIGQSLGRLEEILAQLRRQSDFARHYGLRGVHYSIQPPAVADAVEAAVAEERMGNVYRVE